MFKPEARGLGRTRMGVAIAGLLVGALAFSGCSGDSKDDMPKVAALPYAEDLVTADNIAVVQFPVRPPDWSVESIDYSDFSNDKRVNSAGFREFFEAIGGVVTYDGVAGSNGHSFSGENTDSTFVEARVGDVDYSVSEAPNAIVAGTGYNTKIFGRACQGAGGEVVTVALGKGERREFKMPACKVAPGNTEAGALR